MALYACQKTVSESAGAQRWGLLVHVQCQTINSYASWGREGVPMEWRGSGRPKRDLVPSETSVLRDHYIYAVRIASELGRVTIRVTCVTLAMLPCIICVTTAGGQRNTWKQLLHFNFFPQEVVNEPRGLHNPPVLIISFCPRLLPVCAHDGSLLLHTFGKGMLLLTLLWQKPWATVKAEGSYTLHLLFFVTEFAPF